MIPDDAAERLLDSARIIARECEKLKISQWEVYATQGYGHSLDIEAVSYTHLTLPTICSV